MGILERICWLCFDFLWKGKLECFGNHLAHWQLLAKPEHMGGWGLKHLGSFSMALAAKSLCNCYHIYCSWSYHDADHTVRDLSQSFFIIRVSVPHDDHRLIHTKAARLFRGNNNETTLVRWSPLHDLFWDMCSCLGSLSGFSRAVS